MKTLVKLMILGVLALFMIVMLLSFQIVRSDDGMHIRTKPEWGLGPLVVKDDRTWGERMVDKVKDIDWDGLKKKAQDGWRDLSDEVSRLSDQDTLNSDEAKKALKDFRRELEDRYDKLSESLADRKIDQETFQKKWRELSEWAEERMASIRERFSSSQE